LDDSCTEGLRNRFLHLDCILSGAYHQNNHRFLLQVTAAFDVAVIGNLAYLAADYGGFLILRHTQANP